MGYRFSMKATFQNGLLSGIFTVFLSGFLHKTILNDVKNGFWHVFFLLFCFISNSDPKCRFCMGYSLCKMADLQNGLRFLHRTTLIDF